MRIGISGAFGFLGANVVAEALRQGRDVVAFHSSTTSNPLFDRKSVRMRRLDVLDPTGVRKAFSGCDAIVHLAGAVDFKRAKQRWVWDVNVLGARNVYEAALDLGIHRLVDASSINALGVAEGDRIVDEANARSYAPGNPYSFADAAEALAAADASTRGDYRFLGRSRITYFDSKLAALELARRYRTERGLASMSVFPGTAVGPGDLHYSISHLVDSVWDGRLRFSYPGRTSFMDSRDFARGVLRVLDSGRAGQEYILAGRREDILHYTEFMYLVARTAAGRRGGRARIPAIHTFPGWMGVAVSRIIEAVAPKAGPSYALALSACLGHAFSSDKAVREVGYRPETPLERSILACREFSEKYGKKRG